MYKRLIIAWFVLAVPPTLWLAPQLFGLEAWRGQSDRFAREEDLGVLAGVSLLMALLPLMAMLARRLDWGAGARATPGGGRMATACLAALTLVVAWAGVWIVFVGYALSRDEDMANFGAAILAHGGAWAAIAPEWRAYAHALEPEFVRLSPDAAFWQPDYLPVNSALRALAGWAAPLVGPLLAAASVVMVFAIGRRLWPQRPGLALAAAVLLATSSQVLITAMTPYAMTAHMALNLAWLWLFLRGGRVGHGGAIAVGFLACGLHQLAFHALFAAPFVLQLWLQRRWRLAALYTLAYAAICAFWTDYSPLTLAAQGGAAGVRAGAAGLGGQLAAVIAAHHPPGARSMAENLIRFITWQNPLTAPLAAIGLVGVVKGGEARGTANVMRPLAGGLVLTTLAVSVLMPYQGLGWGYRYWHGLLGPLALIAALGWGRLTGPLVDRDRRADGAVFAAVAAMALLVLAPIRAAQAHTFARPYIAAEAAIRAAPAQIVLIDTYGGWFTADLARNDPTLSNRPLTMRWNNLTPAKLRDLCDRYTIARFDSIDAASFGITSLLTPAETIDLTARRTGMADWTCGPLKTPVSEVRR
jgi:hypothetical protein